LSTFLNNKPSYSYRTSPGIWDQQTQVNMPHFNLSKTGRYSI